MHELPKSILLALGLTAAACKKKSAVPCLNAPPPPDGPYEEPEPPVGPCLKIAPPPPQPEPEPTPDPDPPDVGPCLDIAPGDAPIHPVPPSAPLPTARPDVLRSLIDDGLLPPDVAERLRD